MATVVPIERLRVLPMDVLADVALGKLRRHRTGGMWSGWGRR